MTLQTLAAPSFGEALPIRPSAETLDFLAHRRSASALTLTGSGPGDEALLRLLTLAARAPDHGKLAPWRFVVLRGAAKADFVQGLEAIASARADAAKALAKLGKLKTPPLTVAVISRHIEGEIPEWEQRLSAGAVCALLIVAVQAAGWGANWITDWYAYDEAATRLLGLEAGEKVAGFVHIGAAAEAPLERMRPDMTTIVEDWSPQRPA